MDNFILILNSVIPEKSLFCFLQKCGFIRNPIWFFAKRTQIGFRINFLSPRGEEKVLRNDTVLRFGAQHG